MPRVYMLGGRMYSPTDATTTRQDGWIMAQVEDAGLIDLLANPEKLDDQTIARKLIVQAMRTGKYQAIIAGLLIEGDKPWAVATAQQNAERFADLTDPSEKQTLMLVFVESLTRFFTSGGLFSMPSPTVSANGNGPAISGPISTDSNEAPGPTSVGGSPMETASASS